MFWQLASFPKCQHHVFLSHCQEDRDELVRPVYGRLVDSGIVPFLDVEDYYYGRDSRTALKDGILDSRHTAFFITDNLLSNARGWCVFELAFAEMLDANFHCRGGKLSSAFLPLFLIAQSDERLPRSVWQFVRDRGRFYNSVTEGDPIEWCHREIREFLLREWKQSKNLADLARNDVNFAAELKGVPGRFDRVTKFHPKRLQAT